MEWIQSWQVWCAVRPGRRLAIVAHSLPSSWEASMMMMTSFSANGSLLMDGSRYSFQRSRHCFLVRSERPAAIWS